LAEAVVLAAQVAVVVAVGQPQQMALILALVVLVVEGMLVFTHGDKNDKQIRKSRKRCSY